MRGFDQNSSYITILHSCKITYGNGDGNSHFPKQHIQHEPDSEAKPVEISEEIAKPRTPSSFSTQTRAPVFYALTVPLFLAVAAGAWTFSREPSLTLKPVIAVSMTAASPDMQGESSVTRDMLLTALTGFQTVTVRRQEHDRVAHGHGYDIELKFHGDGDDRMIWWQVVNAETGDLLKSGVEKSDLDGRSPPAARELLAGNLARQIASTRGI